jgi:general stress protein YciG
MNRRLSRETLKEAARIFGREGGKARAKNLSPEKRSEIARHAVEARWAKAKKRKKQGK